MKQKTVKKAIATHRYDNLLKEVKKFLDTARRTAARSVNVILTITYWEIGRRIVAFDQGGKERADYGKKLLKQLSKDLTTNFGRGFSEENLRLMRLFYLTYQEQISQTVSGKSILQSPESTLFDPSTIITLSQQLPLSWSHYVRLLSLDDPNKRTFYEEQAHRAGWSVRQLDRQINAMLYERIALAKNKEALIEKADQNTGSVTPEKEIRDPYVLEFLGLPEPYSEKDLENALIHHLADFLLEMGYGFTFVARQKRLQIGTESYRLDLLLYHRKLRCLVAVDLKVGKFTHADAGQMNLYLNYLKENETLKNEEPPIGIILCAEKDEAVAHYALGGLSNQIFASRYQLQLPDPETLKQEIEAERTRLERHK
jgi:predicted nuclease of restriction endonuclease-like (RecB) superfamily